MTCIAGYVDERNEVWIGADSAGMRADDWSLVIRADQKVFRVGPMVIGFTTSFRMGQVLHYGFTLPEQAAGQGTMAYMVTTFIDAVRARFKDAGFAKKENDVERGGEFLIGYRGRLFGVHGDYQIAEAIDGIYAVGAGAEIAKGALWVHKRARVPAATKVRLALRAAERMNATVRAPFIVLSGGGVK